MRKATAFRGGANKTAPPCFPKAVNSNLVTVPAEQLQRNITLQKSLLLGKTVFHIRQKGVPPLLLPISVLQLPLKPCFMLQPSDFEGNCDSLRFSPRFSLQFLMQFLFASQMWAARPHLGSIFEKLLHRKTFYLPAARSCKNYGVLYDFHTVFIDTHQQECYNIDVHRKNEFR